MQDLGFGLNASGLDVVHELLEQAKINTNAKLYEMASIIFKATLI